MMEQLDLEVAEMLSDYPPDQDSLLAALNKTRLRIGEQGTQIPFLVEANQLLLYWLAVAKDRRRTAVDDKKRWQFVEEYLEAATKGMNTAIIASLGLRKFERIDNGI